MSTTLMGVPSSALDSYTRTVPGWVVSRAKRTALEKVPRHPVPQVAVVNVRTIGFPAESRMSMLTVASKTSAFPRILTGLKTWSPDRGLVTTMAGSGVGDPEIVGEGEPVAEGLRPGSDPDEHATRVTARARKATSGERCLMCPFRRRVDLERFQPVSVTGHLALEAR
jgi:hypothetical protein